MLNLLLEYAEQQGLAAVPGFKKDYVRWLSRFDADGQYLGVTMRDTDDPKKGRSVPPAPAEPAGDES